MQKQLAKFDEQDEATALLFRPMAVLAGIWLIAFLVRLLYLVQLKHAPFFDVLMCDAEAYDAWARQLAAGDWIGKSVFYQAPLYPYFLGVLYAIFGAKLRAVRLVQIVLGSTACSLLAAAGYRFFSPAVGALAGFMLALYPSAIFFDGLIQKAVLDNFFFTLVLFHLACLAHDARRPMLWISAGVWLACLALTRENALILPVLILGWIWVYFRGHSWRLRGAWGLLLFLGISVLLLPVAWRNHHVGGGFEITTSQLGTNLYIGNNLDATGSYMPLRAGHGNPLYEQREATELAERATGRALTPSQVSWFWTGNALAYVRSQPIRWFALFAKKLWLTWNAYEISDTDDQYFSARWSWLLRGLTRVFHFGVICPLAVLGVFLWSDRQRVWLLWLLLTGYSLSVAAFFVFARYRYPLAPILLLFAAAAVVKIVEQKQRATRDAAIRLIRAACPAVLVAVVVNWPTTLQNDQGATILYNVAVIRAKQGQLEQAASCSRQALQIDPNHWGAHNILGRVLAMQGNPSAAVDEFQIALKIAPQSSDLHNNLGNALGGLGRWADALDEFRQAVRLDPSVAEYRNGLGVALVQRGRFIEAAEQFARAIQLNPDYPEARRNYALLLRMQGR